MVSNLQKLNNWLEEQILEEDVEKQLPVESNKEKETTPKQSLPGAIEQIPDALDDWSDGDPRQNAEEIIEIDIENPDYGENAFWIQEARKKVKRD